MNNSTGSGLSIQAATQGMGDCGGGGMAPFAGIRDENEEVSLPSPGGSPRSDKFVEDAAKPAKPARRHHYDWLMM